MTRFKQTEDKYKYIKLGFGDGTIYSYGCYLVSLVNGLNDKGYNFTPEGFNDLLKQSKAWTGEFNNYIDVLRLSSIFPNIFTTYQSVDPWNDTPSLDDLLKPDLVVLCRVSAKPIGGAVNSDHYVLLTGKDGKTAIIHDPWTGKEEKVSARWADYGYIKGIRIFGVKPYQPPADPGEPEKRVLEVVKSGFAGLPAGDELKGGNLEGYARAITEEHKHFKDFEAKAKILDGFIPKWLEVWKLSADGGLVAVEKEMAKLVPFEDATDSYRDKAREILSILLTPDALALLEKDPEKIDEKYLEELDNTKKKIKDLADRVDECQLKHGKTKVIKVWKFGNYQLKLEMPIEEVRK